MVVCAPQAGEARAQHGQALAVVRGQLEGSVPSTGKGDALVVAYEPVWAIGTGRTPTRDDVAEMHGAIRAKLRALLGRNGGTVRILYGGSVKPDNAAELIAQADVDGALVGGASLIGEDFAAIVKGFRPAS